MPASPTNLDVILELWKTHGIFALGWIFVCFMAPYIVWLHIAKDALFREYVAAVKVANASIVPLLEKSVTVMTHVVTVIDSAVDRAGQRDQTLGRLEGQLDIVIRRAVGEDHYTNEAIKIGSERARQTALKVHTDDNKAGRGRSRLKLPRKPDHES